MPLTIVEIGQKVRPCGATIYQKVEIFAIFGAAFPPRSPIGVKFCTTKQTHVPLGLALFGKESPRRGDSLH